MSCPAHKRARTDGAEDDKTSAAALTNRFVRDADAGTGAGSGQDKSGMGRRSGRSSPRARHLEPLDVSESEDDADVGSTTAPAPALTGRQTEHLYDCIARIPPTELQLKHLIMVMRGKWPTHGNDCGNLKKLLRRYTTLDFRPEVCRQACPQLQVKLALAGEELRKRLGGSIRDCVDNAIRHVSRSVLVNAGIQQHAIDEMAIILEHLAALPAETRLKTTKDLRSFIAGVLKT